MNKKILIENLKKAGKPTETYQSPDGTSIVILPYGGRMLGLYAPGSDQNFYWTHTALENVESAREFYAGQQWHNSGGDRTWLAPEADVFFPKFPKLDTYFQPRQLDPGNYQVVKKDSTVQLINKLAITLSRTGQEVPLEISKSFGAAPNPLQHEADTQKLLDRLEYAGYSQYTSLEIQSPDASRMGPVGLWNLVQMPHRGDLLIPTYVPTQPRLIMGQISQDDLIVTNHLIRYKMRAPGEHKISIRALPTAGRIGYLYETADQWAVIIRNFFVNPSGLYVDVPWDATNYFGFSTQACNVNSGLGQFSELEYHIPAVGKGTGRTRCDDAAQVWAFRGSYADIQTVIQMLLTTEI